MGIRHSSVETLGRLRNVLMIISSKSIEEKAEMKMTDLFLKYKSVILYLIFGVLTTLINIVAYWFCAYIFSLSTIGSTVIAWVLAVLFAYITNRRVVFESQVTGVKGILGEVIAFFACRLATGLVDLLCMYVFVDVLGLNDIIIKIAANILVIMLNYVASKLVIFKKTNRHGRYVD